MSFFKPFEGSFELELSSPITDEQWDMLSDVDFDHTDHIWFHTKHGKEVHFYKNAIPIEWIEKKISSLNSNENDDDIGDILGLKTSEVYQWLLDDWRNEHE